MVDIVYVATIGRRGQIYVQQRLSVVRKKFILKINGKSDNGVCLTMLEDILRSMKNIGWIEQFSLEPAKSHDNEEWQKTANNIAMDALLEIRAVINGHGDDSIIKVFKCKDIFSRMASNIVFDSIDGFKLLELPK